MDILDKLNSTIYNYDELRDMEIVLEMGMLVSDDVMINEAFELGMFKTGMKALMKGAGIGAHKSGEGLIQIALKSGKVMAEFIWNALKAVKGDEVAKQRVIELANKEIKKEQVLDFLLKLDTATLHLVSGPLHIIDALTGWHVWAQIQGHTEDAMAKGRAAIRNLIDASKSADEVVKKKIKGYIHGVAKLLGIDVPHREIQAF